MSSLTEEQKLRIEENRRKALLRRAERSQTQPSHASTGNAELTKVANHKPTNVPLKRKYDGTFNSKQGSSSPHFQSTNRASGSRTNTVPINKESFYGTKKQVVAGSCHLISADRFMVEVGYNQDMIAMFQKVPDRRYHPDERHWSFPVSRHDQLMAALKPLHPGVAVAPLPAHVLRCLRQPAPDAGKVDLSALDATLLEALMPFQREGIKMGVARDGRVLLADDMGLGKTIQAIGIASHFHDWPLLVVCPSSMRYQWRNEFLRFLPSQHPSTIMVMDSSKDFTTEARVLIVSYDLLSRCSKQLRDVGFRSVIMDESHNLKNPKAARTRAALPLLRAARRALLLSGTPALSRPVELYTQISAIDRKFMPVFNDFGLRYCDGKRNAWGWDFSGSSRMTELQILLERRIMIRRLKRDVITQLPSKQRHLVLLDPGQVHCRTKKMNAMETRMAKASLKAAERRGALLEYFRETATAKLPAVCSYLEDLLDSGAKFICFAHHRVVMDAVCELLERRKDQHIRIDGSTQAAQRKRECDRFQSGSAVRVAVLSITAANTGLTLTAASLVVFAELFWNPGVLTQAEDRAHRIGQQDSVQIRYLVARGTADDHIWPLVQRKLDVLNRAGLSKDDFTEADEDRQRSSDQQPLITDLFQQLASEDGERPDADGESTESGKERAPSVSETGMSHSQRSDGSATDDAVAAAVSEQWVTELCDADWDEWMGDDNGDVPDAEGPTSKESQ
ncbi:SWI/SNF-related matrix-associated actin-dependent regulator of chromatin subfamily A-like protein 1 [Amphibalanus amphitrite]|uniref:SWI/SNF-related matrix-associated actin-dependent regulator of chromatin subfamily A-like protein 1 n=1 Tax=Amphibalanus amphitrite TaxID=1232801 RepID=A0A6A4XBL7_AMPAM|nr:SWI/SNF-related matrix-associated actin-dependent regulator of chromatin subfamily A-like protein 1 [Amphibalanus amphitrite]KAF0311822.1 SWI/SNF-related matrix-associated actin-dependent regulator of chromatin subfamily A-like protein 1 [Amphibalanus amphitrite]